MDHSKHFTNTCHIHPFTHIHSHTHTLTLMTEAAVLPTAHQEQFGVQFLAQGMLTKCNWGSRGFEPATPCWLDDPLYFLSSKVM